MLVVVSSNPGEASKLINWLFTVDFISYKIICWRQKVAEESLKSVSSQARYQPQNSTWHIGCVGLNPSEVGKLINGFIYRRFISSKAINRRQGWWNACLKSVSPRWNHQLQSSTWSGGGGGSGGAGSNTGWGWFIDT